MPQMEPILIYGEMNEKRVGNKLHSSGFFDHWKLDCFADLLRIPVASILSSGVQSEEKIPNFGRFACLSEPDIILQSESGFFEQFAGEIAGAV